MPKATKPCSKSLRCVQTVPLLARRDPLTMKQWFLQNSAENSHTRPRTLVMAKLDYYYLHGDYAKALDIGRQLLSTPDGDDSEVLDATLRCALRANVYDADLVELARRYKNYVRLTLPFLLAGGKQCLTWVTGQGLAWNSSDGRLVPCSVSFVSVDATRGAESRARRS